MLPLSQTNNFQAMKNKFVMKSSDNDSSDGNSDNAPLIVDFPSEPRQRNSRASRRERVCKSVSFSSTSTLHQYFRETIDPFTGEPITWSRKSDYKKFRQNTRDDVVETRLQQQRRSLPSALEELTTEERLGLEADKNLNFVGIEHLVCQTTLMMIIQAREAHKHAVLGEYARQVEIGITDPSSLRATSKRHSRWAKSRAYANAGGNGGNRRILTPAA
mmetsp:Transcript_10870/g.23009  ORF Transcript_10870/g.23009 Transcript_10870/m.23009 type:complete len:217 (-) Transcript_10870:48-698(-)